MFSKLSVSVFSNTQRLGDILAHLLLSIGLLPLLDFEVLTINLVQILDKLLLLTFLAIFLFLHFLSLLLASLHILELDLTGNHSSSLSATIITFCEREEAIGIRLS